MKNISVVDKLYNYYNQYVNIGYNDVCTSVNS